MQKIDNIEIKNFKSIQQAEIKDCRRVNIFIGYPNVGKSNILEAISLLTFIRQKRPTGLRNLVRIEKLTQLFNYFKIKTPASIDFNEKFSLNVSYEDEDGIRMNLIDKTLSQYDYSSLSGLRIGSETIISGTVNDIDSFSGRFQELQEFRVKPYKYSSEKKFNKSFSALELQVPNGENMNEVIINNPVLKKDFREILKEDGFDIVIENSSNEIFITRGINDGIANLIPLPLIADTLLRVMFFKSAILSNKRTVLLFEEPEAHMFPPYIAKFMADIIFDKNDNQYFIATHSPFVLNDFMEDMDKSDLSIYVVGLKDGETVVKRLTDIEITEVYQYGVDLFFNLEDYLKNAVS